MVTRRSFIAGTLAVLAQPAAAQRKPLLIGVLDPLPFAGNAANMEQLRKGLRDAGYGEFALEYRSSEGRAGRYAQFAAELARRPVDVLVARGTPAPLAAKNAAGPVPVIALGVTDPVETGLVASLERPGGNVTGIALLIHDLEARRVDVLRALAPRTRRIAALMNLGNPALVHAWKVMEEAARGFKLEAIVVDVRKPERVPAAFDTAKAREADGVILQVGALDPAQRERAVQAAARLRLPAL